MTFPAQAWAGRARAARLGDVRTRAGPTRAPGLPDQLRVGFAAPHLGFAPVPLIPGGSCVRWAAYRRAPGKRAAGKAGAAVVRVMLRVMQVGRVFAHAPSLPRAAIQGNGEGRGKPAGGGMLDWWNLMCSDAQVFLFGGTPPARDWAFFM